jgi:hypothetical protein
MTPELGRTFALFRFTRRHKRSDFRAASAYDQEFKTMLLRVAAQYRELALQIDDPKQWRAKRAAARTKQD